ncbi:MAG TPA: CoA-binding protein [Terriglobia bacterium]|nr:CoA-binding protein [Terriglobia bacterium]
MASPGVSNHWNNAEGQLARPYPECDLQDPIGDILQRFKTLAVVGLSPKPSRPSHGVASYMRSHGYRVIPVNPNANSIFGEHCYASLEDIPAPVEVVVIFRRSEFVPPVVESAIRIGAHVVWMQEGVEHEAAAKRAREAGLEVVEDRCILKEHAKRFVAEGI